MEDRHILRALILGGIVLLGGVTLAHNVPAHAAGATYEQAVRNYNIGRYGAVLAAMRPQAERGDAEAQVMLGRCYENGLGVSRNAATAASWYQKAAQQGNTVAQTLLAYCYQTGDGVPQSMERAVQLFHGAAERGNAEAQYRLGVLLHNGGNGVVRDRNTAAQWFLLSARQGNAYAQRYLGIYHRYGLGGMPRDAALADEWFAKAAAQGIVEADIYAHPVENVGTPDVPPAPTPVVAVVFVTMNTVRCCTVALQTRLS